MACFLVPVTEAVITTTINAFVKKSEKKNENGKNDNNGKIKLSTKIGWLNKMLWGGSALLAFEHVWHGEVTPVFPFLTAVENGETAGMLREMATAGVSMAVLVTVAWLAVLGVTAVIEKRKLAEPAETEKETAE